MKTQMYSLKMKKNVMVPNSYICVKKYKNGSHALYADHPTAGKMSKIFSPSDLKKMEKKYGKCTMYSKSVRRSRSRRRSRRKSRK